MSVLFFNQTEFSTLDTGVTALAPATVQSGGTFQAQLTADPIEVPTAAGSYSLLNLNTVTVRFNVPAGTQYVGATLSGGSNLGSGAPTVGLVSGQIRLTVPGPLTPGSTAVLPTVTVTLQATGPVGSVIRSQLAGSSYTDPAVTFTARVGGTPVGTLNAPTTCFAPTNPFVTETTII